MTGKLAPCDAVLRTRVNSIRLVHSSGSPGSCRPADWLIAWLAFCQTRGGSCEQRNEFQTAFAGFAQVRTTSLHSTAAAHATLHCIIVFVGRITRHSSELINEFN